MSVQEINVRVAGQVVLSADKTRTVLIKKVATGKYSLPKGKLEKGESWLQAADRERLEESGIDSKDVRSLVDSETGQAVYLDEANERGNHSCRYSIAQLKVDDSKTLAATFTTHNRSEIAAWFEIAQVMTLPTAEFAGRRKQIVKRALELAASDSNTFSDTITFTKLAQSLEESLMSHAIRHRAHGKLLARIPDDGRSKHGHLQKMATTTDCDTKSVTTSYAKSLNLTVADQKTADAAVGVFGAIQKSHVAAAELTAVVADQKSPAVSAVAAVGFFGATASTAVKTGAAENAAKGGVGLSKTLTWILRHKALELGLVVGEDGGIEVDKLLATKDLKGVSLADLQRVVHSCDKQRFSMYQVASGQWHIKANQGHSRQVGSKIDDSKSLTPLTVAVPVCVHGTNRRAWKEIQKDGLRPMGRKHIHFASHVDPAKVVSGIRQSSSVHVHIDMTKALADGIPFFLSENGVILSPGNKDGLIGPQYFKK